MVNEPLVPSSKTRVLTLLELPSAKPLWTCQIEGFGMSASWRRDSTIVVINGTGPPDRRRPLLVRTTRQVEVLALPDELDPLQCIDEADRAGPWRWWANTIVFEKWRENGDLELNSLASIAQLDENQKPVAFVSSRVDWILRVSQNSTIEIISRKRASYQKATPPA